MTHYAYRGNLHGHTPYSDGALYHAEVAQEAIRAGLDFVVLTDHNVWVDGVERYHVDARPQPPAPPARIGYPAEPPPAPKRVLLLAGEEVHDRQRTPQGSHCLVYGAERELAPYGDDPQQLLDAAAAAGGLTFLAHPFEKAAPAVGEAALPWLDWDVQGFTGLEIWNYMSEFKGLLRYPAVGWRYLFNPETGIKGPFAATLAKWDLLLAEGRRVVGVGGADAHGLTYRLGPLTRVIFPYEDLFRTINTHVLTRKPLSGEVQADKALIYEALREGHCWVGYDLPAATDEFRFSASGWRSEAIMGDAIPLGTGVTLQTRVGRMADIRLIRHGEVVASAVHATNLTYIAHDPGAYRAEVRLPFLGRSRGWIFSNPIYVTQG